MVPYRIFQNEISENFLTFLLFRKTSNPRLWLKYYLIWDIFLLKQFIVLFYTIIGFQVNATCTLMSVIPLTSNSFARVQLRILLLYFWITVTIIDTRYYCLDRHRLLINIICPGCSAQAYSDQWSSCRVWLTLNAF